MSVKERFAAAALAAVLLCLAACDGDVAPGASDLPEETPSRSVQPTPNREETVPFTLAWNPEDTLNPLEAGTPNQTLAPLVFQGLFAVNGVFEAENVLCERSVQSEDGRSWTFTLREGVAFSDGTPLAASHVADCLNAARSSALYGDRLSAVSAVTADGSGVTVTLNEPNGNLPVLLDVPVFLEREESAYPLGTGPYCFDGEGESACLRGSPAWQGAAMPMDTILLYRVSSADERIAAFDTGRVTLVDTDFTASGALGYSGRYESWDYPTTAMLYLGFNIRRGACREGALRQAVAWSMDRDNTASSLLSGHADAGLLPVSPRCALYDEALAEELAHTTDDAAGLLAEAGYERNDEGVLTLRGRPVSLTLVVNSENAFRTGLADHMAGELGKLGLSVTVSKLPWDDYLTALERGNFDLYLGQVKLTADFDLTVLVEGGLNYGGYSGKETSALLERFRAASDAERPAAAAALYRQLAAEVPFTPLCFIRGSVLTRWGAVSGLTPAGGNPFYAMEHWKTE